MQQHEADEADAADEAYYKALICLILFIRLIAVPFLLEFDRAPRGDGTRPGATWSWSSTGRHVELELDRVPVVLELDCDQASSTPRKYSATSISSGSSVPGGAHVRRPASTSTRGSAGVDRSMARASRSTTQYSSTPSSR